MYENDEMIGEWWIIDGSAIYADGNIGDMNHEGYVIDHIRSKYGCVDMEWREYKKSLAIEKFEEEFGETPTEEYIDDNQQQMDDLMLKKLNEMGMTNEEYVIAEENGDARKYGLEKLGWKRVARNNIETFTLTVEDLQEISNGLYDAYGDEIKDSTKFNIEVISTRAFYTDVPYSIISEYHTSSLRIYAANWYKKYIFHSGKKSNGLMILK